MPTLTTILTLCSMLLASAALKPKNSVPSHSAPKPTVKHKVSLPRSPHLVTSVPEPPAGLEYVVALPPDFMMVDGTSKYSRQTSGLYPVHGDSVGKSGVAEALVRLPAGVTVEWFDCRIDYWTDAEATNEVPRATFVLRRFSYADSSNHLIGGLSVQAEARTPTSAWHTYWNSEKVTPVRIETANQYVWIEAMFTSYGRSMFSFKGCRVGYRR